MAETTLPFPVGTHLTGVHAVRRTPLSGTLIDTFGTTGRALQVQKTNSVIGVMDAASAVRTDAVEDPEVQQALRTLFDAGIDSGEKFANLIERGL
jgi:hypothetical protein